VGGVACRVGGGYAAVEGVAGVGGRRARGVGLRDEVAAPVAGVGGGVAAPVDGAGEAAEGVVFAGGDDAGGGEVREDEAAAGEGGRRHGGGGADHDVAEGAVRGVEGAQGARLVAEGVGRDGFGEQQFAAFRRPEAGEAAADGAEGTGAAEFPAGKVQERDTSHQAPPIFA
jgi:hypothetical protein